MIVTTVCCLFVCVLPFICQMMKIYVLAHLIIITNLMMLTFSVLWCLSGHCSRRLCADSDRHLNLARSAVDGAAHGPHICLHVIRSPEDQKSRSDTDRSFPQGKALQQERAQRKGMLKNT